MKISPILACFGLGLCSVSPASAYSYESNLSDGCHEKLSGQALRAVRAKLPNAAAVDASKNEKALIRDLEFRIADDLADLNGATFLIGIRDNDLKGLAAAQVDNLAQVHGNPDNQKEHCLRDRGDDEPDGTAKAIADCRAFIKQRITEALDGLDADGTTNTSVRTSFEVTLGLRGKTTATLPTYWFRMGQALHAVQDSFSHTYRSEDRRRIRVAMNWIDYVEAHDDEARDGPQHRSGMDQCEDLDSLRQINFGVAQSATEDLLSATLDPSLDRDAKLAKVDAVLDAYMTVDSAGCTKDNHWCNAPEEKYAIARSCGCSIIGDSGGETIAAGLVTSALALTIVRRRRRERRAR